MARWEEYLEPVDVTEEELVDLVERHPMHLEEIDLMARLAPIDCGLRGKTGKPGLAEVQAALKRRQSSHATPLLFGGNARESTEDTGHEL